MYPASRCIFSRIVFIQKGVKCFRIAVLVFMKSFMLVGIPIFAQILYTPNGKIINSGGLKFFKAVIILKYFILRNYE